MKKLLIISIVLISAYMSQAQDSVLYRTRIWVSGKDTLNYRVLYPEHYASSKKYPVVVFLHGAGERGNDNKSQLKHGGHLFANDTSLKEFPAIVIFPQLPRDSTWARMKFEPDTVNKKVKFMFPFTGEPTVPEALVKGLLDSLRNERFVDKKRIYIGGLSMGGFGTFDMIALYPDYFAAAFPICGGGNIDNAPRFARKLPIWIFHGAADSVVSVEYSRSYYKALKDLGAKVKYTEYPGVGHNSWDNAFAEKDLLPWLFSKKKR